MRLVVGLEQRFARAANGAIVTESNFDYAFWQRYLEVFDSLVIVARVQETAEVRTSFRPVEGEGISLRPLPFYIGPLQYVTQARRVSRTIHEAIATDDAVIVRIPGQVGSVLTSALRESGPNRPYGVEVVGDPFDVFATGAVRHPLRPFFRWWFPRQLRKQVRLAASVAYVNQGTLRQRYPEAPGAFSTHYSSLDLRPEALVPAPRQVSLVGVETRAVMVGSLEQMYKAPDVLLNAVFACRASGLNMGLTIIGDGKHRSELESRSRSLSLQDHVAFLGQLPAGDAVRKELDTADLFILPSRTEGLPRAMIEAMARGLPCIGSTVGGIPELLPPEDMVPPGDAAALAAKIQEVARDPGRMNRMSARNLEKARAYRSDLLRERRIAFYRSVRDQTEAWLHSKDRQ